MIRRNFIFSSNKVDWRLIDSKIWSSFHSWTCRAEIPLIMIGGLKNKRIGFVGWVWVIIVRQIRLLSISDRRSNNIPGFYYLPHVSSISYLDGAYSGILRCSLLYDSDLAAWVVAVWAVSEAVGLSLSVGLAHLKIETINLYWFGNFLQSLWKYKIKDFKKVRNTFLLYSECPLLFK